MQKQEHTKGNAIKEIGIIGLGAMGYPLAERILHSPENYEVTVYNRTRQKADPLKDLGARIASEPYEAAQGDVVISMLANDEAVEAVILHDDFLLEHAATCTHVSMSTISIDLVQRLTQEAARSGRSFVSCPVMGRPDVMARGEAISMPAGATDAIAKISPLLMAFSKVISVVGDQPMQANAVKLAANFMISSMIETFAEAFALVRKNNVDHHMFYEIMADDFFASPIYKKYGALIANGDFAGGAFSVELQEKDTRLALEAAIASRVAMPFLHTLENVFISAIGRDKGAKDPCAIAEIAWENSGL